jgi:hypothetical protein
MIYWTKEYTPADLIGIPLSHLDEFKIGVALDLKNKKIIRGNSSNFCKNLLSKVHNLESNEAEQYIKERLQQIYSIADKIFEMIVEKSVPLTSFDPFLKDLDFDDIEFIETYLKSQHPNLIKEISKTISLFKNKISKILGGFGKEKW